MGYNSKEKKKEWRSKNPEKLRVYENRSTARAKSILLGILGDKCKKCGIDDPRVLQIDHMNGKGNQMRMSGVRGTRKLLAYVRKHGASGFQVLCANCNWIKRYENNEAKYAVHK